MPERVCVFIDGSNLYHLCRENFGRTDLNIGMFAQWLVGPNRTLVRTYYYNCPLPPDHPPEKVSAQQRFFGKLARTPYVEVRLGKLVQRTGHPCAKCGDQNVRWVEKGVDMRIGIDMLSAASRNLYDVAVLGSGDGDLAEAVRAVKDLGRHVEVTGFTNGTAYELVQAADVLRKVTTADVQSCWVRT